MLLGTPLDMLPRAPGELLLALVDDAHGCALCKCSPEAAGGSLRDGQGHLWGHFCLSISCLEADHVFFLAEVGARHLDRLFSSHLPFFKAQPPEMKPECCLQQLFAAGSGVSGGASLPWRAPLLTLGFLLSRWRRATGRSRDESVRSKARGWHGPFWCHVQLIFFQGGVRGGRGLLIVPYPVCILGQTDRLQRVRTFGG